MGSKKRVVLDLNAKVKVIEASEKDKLTVKQIVDKFKIGKTQVCQRRLLSRPRFVRAVAPRRNFPYKNYPAIFLKLNLLGVFYLFGLNHEYI
jgi:hypothetical protein